MAAASPRSQPRAGPARGLVFRPSWREIRQNANGASPMRSASADWSLRSFVGDNERDRLLDVGVRACVLDGGTEGMPRPAPSAASGTSLPSARTIRLDASYIRRLGSEKVWLATSVSLRCP